ncbi:MAG: di-trans,poly-cis-decaprenylcistransferase, partial [Clostridiaceae bacterium]|nr:di-trans,poly-cis-decaprenylcistransferase [Clostridiaceae bacterium]
IEERTKDRNGLCLNIALNYGGKSEITNAVRNIVKDVQDGKIKREDIDENLISTYLYTAGQPEPDLIIRPSGEYRISNFLLWQCAYSEFWFSNVLWPDFSMKHLKEAILDYQNRSRRFGGI